MNTLIILAMYLLTSEAEFQAWKKLRFDGKQEVESGTCQWAGPVHVRAKDQEEKRWLLYADDASLTYDGLAIVNLGDEETVIRIKQLDGQGDLVDEKVLDEVLGPKAKATVVLDQLFAWVENGSFEIEADAPLSVLALRGDFDSSYVWENRAVAQ